MLKQILTTIATLVIISVSLCACSNKIEETSPQTPSAETQIIETTSVKDVFEEETPTNEQSQTITLDEIPEPIIEETKNSSKEFLSLALYELGIGFNDYGVNYEITNNSMIVNSPYPQKNITQMYANNEFLNNHKIEFIIPENSSIQKFIPPTYESMEFGYVEDDTETWVSIGEIRGYVWESSLDSHTGICWEYDITVEIVIDDEYHIYINK